MASRRPAKDQPASFDWTPENKAWCEEQIKKYPQGRQASCVIPFLWRGQKQEGWVSIPMMERIARQLDMPYIRVYEVATFYTMFNLAPEGEFFVQLCGTTPCMLRGSNELREVCKKVIGEEGHVTEDGKFSWLEVECLGACCNAPMIQISTKDGDHYYEDLTPEILEDLLGKLARGEEVKIGTQHPGRHTSDPEGDNTTLTDPSLYDGSRAQPLKEIPNSAPKEPAGQ
ncbi:NADH-quinone oxidoreductase subunit NuoE [Hyphococcus luteus]|uniref:NADH-quinone oxidoreductase subunit NuoE n=1 Tax=Hyphococcus luteus TaxID=2058213 RepID=A0A2S7KAH2_9PROT|nr:NADH-quinone oxidoreductase subunit NuoE [Marinicaulis flavus]PQA89481.1 NADH-quinone oxidoreductase subunit NuoE [Marinicaulis flavus]